MKRSTYAWLMVLLMLGAALLVGFWPSSVSASPPDSGSSGGVILADFGDGGDDAAAPGTFTVVTNDPESMRVHYERAGYLFLGEIPDANRDRYELACMESALDVGQRKESGKLLGLVTTAGQPFGLLVACLYVDALGNHDAIKLCQWVNIPMAKNEPALHRVTCGIPKPQGSAGVDPGGGGWGAQPFA